MRYHYKAQHMPIISGTVKQEVFEDHYKWAHKNLIKVKPTHKFETGDKVYIEVINNMQCIACTVKVEFLSNGYLVI